MMEIVIKITEEDYERVKKKFQISMNIMANAIAHGTPLPEHHGRLIDADYMIKQLLSLPKDEFSTEDAWAMKVLDLAPTIIEAEESRSK